MSGSHLPEILGTIFIFMICQLGCVGSKDAIGSKNNGFGGHQWYLPYCSAKWTSRFRRSGFTCGATLHADERM